MAGVFAFEKLAAELRLKIYEHLFIAPSEIRVHYTKTYCATEASRRWHDYELLLKGRIADEGVTAEIVKAMDINGMLSYRRSPFGPGEATNCLRINKAILAEALPVLYGENTFVFGHPDDLDDFTQMIAGNGQHLQHIKVPMEVASFRCSAVESLARIHPLACIRSMSFCILPEYKGSEDEPSLETVWQGAKAFVQGSDDAEKRTERFEAIRVERWLHDIYETMMVDFTTVAHPNEHALLAEVRSILETEGVLQRFSNAD